MIYSSIRINGYLKAAGFLVVLIFLFSSCERGFKTNGSDNLLFCDVETINETENVVKYNLPLLDVKLELGGLVSSEKAYSGIQSILLNTKKSFGFISSYKRTDDINYIKVSVWRYDPDGLSKLIFQGDKESGVYIKDYKIVERNENGWEKIEMEYYPPLNVIDYKIYVWRASADSVYFDDFKIEYFYKKNYPEYLNQSKLHIYFSDSKINSFEKKIKTAYSERIHFSDGEWLKGIMSDETNVMPIKARLKGDWLDHFIGEKWSLRIKMREDYVFNRMRVFSIQSPQTRFFLNEYVVHNLFDNEDVLTTRYGFTPVYRNRSSIGIFAWEEHFAKQLIEYNLRREGPILKFDEDPFWRVNQFHKQNNKWLELPYYETSRIIAFGMGKILEKPNLKAQFDIAQGLMYQYKNALTNAEELFDIEALAKYWALIDISNGRHGLTWHNQRLYYNPVLCKLEPINFDNYTDQFDPNKKAIITALERENGHKLDPSMVLYEQLFSSREFLEKYYYYLDTYTNEEFLSSFLKDQEEYIQKYESLIASEFQDYQFDDQFLFQNQVEIRKQLPELKKKIDEGWFDNFNYTLVEKVATDVFIPKAIPNYINTYYNTADSLEANILIENFSGKEITAIGLADENNRLIHSFEGGISLQAYVRIANDTSFKTIYNEDISQFVFKVKDDDAIFYSEITPWEKKTNLSPYQELLRTFDFETCNLFEKRDHKLIVSGKHIIDEKILIPSGFDVVFEEGCQIDFINESGFISYSPVFMNGSTENPINIYSSDSSANAFTVLQAVKRSKLNNVIFKDLNTLNYNGWTLTGAVNFYESDVDIDNCTFASNHCEDALNIIRSDFFVTGAYFNKILSDAFDSDFCTGILENSKFYEVLNDAIDFSTSQIEIRDCVIDQIGDKGVSGGEGSTITVTNTQISNCNIGAASKDLSDVKLTNVSIDSCYYGLVLLKKKPEYGPARLITNKLKLSNCEIKHLVELESVLHLNNRKINGTHKNLSQEFY